MANFGNLYTYNSGTATVEVIPDTSAVRSKIETAFVEIFGSSLSTDPTTAIGRIIEALTILFVDVLGVNAQNANSFSPNHALGGYLDALGSIWGIGRLLNEDDASYRRRIILSQSRGNGYVASIYNAVGQVDDVTSVCVLDNNTGDVVVKDGIALPAHSVFICVGGNSYDDDDVAEAIYRTKSAGCAYQNDASHGTLVTRQVTDSSTGSTNNVIWHRAVEKPIEISVIVNGSLFTGSDIVAATKAAIKSIVAKHSINSTLTSTMIASGIAASGTGIVCTGASITSGGTAEDPITVLPYQYFNITDSDITVTVA